MFSKKNMIVTAALLSLLPSYLAVPAGAGPLVSQLIPPSFMPIVPPKAPAMPVPPPASTSQEQSDKAIQARVLLMLGTAAEDDGKVLDAINMYKQVVAISEKSDEPSYDAAIAAGRLGAVYADLKNFPEALRFARMALMSFQKIEGPINNDVGIELNNLAWIEEQMGKPSEAEKTYKQALAVLKASNDENDDLIAVSENNLADLCMQGHRYKEAVERYQAASNYMNRFYGPQHPLTRMITHKLARAQKLAK